jgi:hypothetical protein
MGAIRQMVGRDASRTGSFQCSGLLIVADDSDHLAGDCATGTGVDHRLQRGAFMGREDRDPHVSSIPFLSAQRQR